MQLTVKTKVIIILSALLVLISVALYFYYRNTTELRTTYTAGIETMQKVESEKARCNEVLNSDAGNFDQYEYCKQLLKTF